MKALESTLEERVRILRGNEYFEDLPEPVLRELAAHVILRDYQKGEVLFWEGDPCEGLYVIQRGSAKIFRLSMQGRQFIVRVLQEGDTFAEVPAFDGAPNPVNVEALEPCCVWVVDRVRLRALIRSQPDFAEKVLSNFGRMLRSMIRGVSEMAFYQVTHRLARLISELAAEKPGVPWTQEQLAARLGTVREVVARSIRELERSGAIRIEDRRILIADAEAFDQWVLS